ncbi:MAG TPA: hypothetical protein VIM22_10090, partial [Solirubrobacteraceae bacterium]
MDEVDGANRSPPIDGLFVISWLRIDHRPHPKEPQGRTQAQSCCEPRRIPRYCRIEPRQLGRP